MSIGQLYRLPYHVSTLDISHIDLITLHKANRNDEGVFCEFFCGLRRGAVKSNTLDY